MNLHAEKPSNPLWTKNLAQKNWAFLKQQFIKKTRVISKIDNQLKIEYMVVDPAKPISDKRRVTSEGIGYFMLNAVQMDDSECFFNLFMTAEDLFKIRGGELNGLYFWSIAEDGASLDSNNASDAELDIALAMLWAIKRIESNATAWRKYKSELPELKTRLNELLYTIRLKIVGTIDYDFFNFEPDFLYIKPWAARTDENDLLQFNPSYFKPMHFESFAIYDKDHFKFYKKVIDDGYLMLGKILDYNQKNKNGRFFPDWINLVFTNFENQVGLSFKEHRQATQGYDSIRVYQNLAEHNYFNNDQRAKDILQRTINGLQPSLVGFASDLGQKKVQVYLNSRGFPVLEDGYSNGLVFMMFYEGASFAKVNNLNKWNESAKDLLRLEDENNLPYLAMQSPEKMDYFTQILSARAMNVISGQWRIIE